jgi:hypothetical protein
VNAHGIIRQARREPCTYCHRQPPGLCRTCPDGVHACRAYRTCDAGNVTCRDLALVTSDAGIYDGRSLLYDPEVTP